LWQYAVRITRNWYFKAIVCICAADEQTLDKAENLFFKFMRVIKKYTLCMVTWIFLLPPVLAQTKTIDSLKGLLQNEKQDTNRIKLNYLLAEKLTGYDVIAAGTYLEAGYAVAKSDGNKYYSAKYFFKKADLIFDNAKYTTAILYYDSAIVLYNEVMNEETEIFATVEKYQLEKTNCLIGKALVSAKLYHFQESTAYCLEGIAGIEHIKGNKKNALLATLHADIASNYYDLEQFENSLQYDKLGLVYLNRNEDIDVYVIGHLFVADDFSALSQFDSSSVYLEKVRPVVMQLNKPNLDVRFYYILGGIHRKQKEWNNALAAYQKAKEAAKKIKDDFQIVNSEEGLAACYLHTGNLTKARELALHVFKESVRIKTPLFKVQSLQLLAEIEEKAGNIDKAFQYQKQFIIISDSVKKEKVQRQMNETEVKYQTEKKQKEILLLQKDSLAQSLSIKKKSTLNYFLIGSLAALMIVGFLGYRNFRHRQQLAKQQDVLQQQRISELEKDKQLVAVDAMLQGQEEERSRLAKDLHDGLGGLLSGVKFSLSNMKDNLIVTPDNMTVFERSLDMLDTSIKELRRVAHNMMPELLTKFGLDEALKEYCNSINATNLVSVKYQSMGMGTRVEKSAEIIIYRIIQELLNNIMKHAAAKEALVQLVKEEGRLSIIVEDDGKGFDTAIIKNNKGAGLTSIQSRVDYLKGQLDIHSEAGKGTLVNIEFNI
jgi:two-component system, NarL family, sensor kinase